ncbi:tetratricopeptide repeat protein [Streptomyces sp. NPDC029041]|uniref:tetratricopeptide repeat protein n=1 Tax=Streptomyces sp. NPDC029041 TaxID=3155727 RepID=UPI0033CB108E
MGERRCLLVGSQCDTQEHLSRLGRAVTDLDAVFRDPALGGCRPALPDGTSLLLDPDASALEEGLRTAVARASADGATLFVAFTGHGFATASDFHLMTRKSSVGKPESAYALGKSFTDLLLEHPHLDGLVLVLDACESGHVLTVLGDVFKDIARSTGKRFEVLVSTGTGAAFACAFTAALARLMRSGTGTPRAFLTAHSALPLLCGQLRAQHPSHRVYDRGTEVSYNDPSLWLALNASRARRGIEQLADLLTWYRPTSGADTLAGQLDGHRAVAVTAPAGQGKSAFVASQAAQHDAVAVVTAATTPETLAEELARDLRRLPGFPAAVSTFRQTTPDAALAGLDALHAQVLGPLALLGQPVRVVVDGLDQLSATAHDPVLAGLDDLASDPRLEHVSLLVTARTGTRLPHGAREFALGTATRAELASYLTERGVPPHLHATILDRADGNWLAARTYADVAGALETADDLPSSLGAAFDRSLDAARTRPDRGDPLLDAVLTVLAAAGPGPVLPMSLLMEAVRLLAGPEPAHLVRDVLVRLQGLLVRSAAGTDEELVGFFHALLVEHLTSGDDLDLFEDLMGPPEPDGTEEPLPPSRRVRVTDGHGALADVLHARVPHQTQGHGTQPFDYALAAEPEHLWRAGRQKAVLHGLQCRTAARPADNLARWSAWLPRLTDAFGERSAESLTARHQLSGCTEATGRPAEALALARRLADDCRAALGPRHTATLAVRHDLIRWDDGGDLDERLEQAHALVSDVQQVHGPAHADTLGAQQTVAWLIGTRDPALGRTYLEEMLPTATRVLGAGDARVLLLRLNITYRLKQEGRQEEARSALAELVPEMAARLPAHDRHVLTARANLVELTAECGRHEEALAQSAELVSAMERVYGDEHPDVLTVRSNYAVHLLRAHRRSEALALLRQVANDQTRVLGPTHTITLATRAFLNRLDGG